MISGFWEKLGFWSPTLIKEWKSKTNWIWFHAVSVGELNAIFPLIEEVIKNKKEFPVMLSTTTKAGYKLAKELTKEKEITVFYFPFDISGVVNSLLRYAKVKLLVIAETEIWPCVLSTCKRKNIPVILVNGRLSDKSFKGYYLFKFYFKNIINSFTEVLSQSQSDTDKFLELGLNKDKIKTLGNIKFYTPDKNTLEKNGFEITQDTKTTTNIIFASTHPGEDEISITVYKDLLKEFPNIRLIIAPRHIERANNIAKLIKENGFNPVFRSKNESISSKDEIFILDKIGELANIYKKCQITVLGGTFVKIGGHNILEPIRANSYTIIGPYDYKISELSNYFKSNNAIIQVTNKDEITSKIKEALLDLNLRETIINNGKRLIEENKNVFKNTTKQILTYI